MAPRGASISSPTLDTHEIESLVAYLRIFVDAGAVALRGDELAIPPHERWEVYDPAGVAERLSSRVRHVFARYSWQRSGTHSGDSVTEEIERALKVCGETIDERILPDVLLAAAYFIDPPPQSAFTDERALGAIEEFCAFVNGYLQSLPLRRTRGEDPKAVNARFLNYQRRRYGYETSTRAPRSLVKRLPLGAQEIVDAYADRLSYESSESAQVLMARLAVALARPADPVIVDQLDLTFATIITWRTMIEFPAEQDVHPLFGLTPAVEPELWQKASDRGRMLLTSLTKRRAHGSDPAWVLNPSTTPVGNDILDGPSLQSLSRLDEFVTAFAAWTHRGLGERIAPNERLDAFSTTFSGRKRAAPGSGESGATRRATRLTGSALVAQLPEGARKTIASAREAPNVRREVVSRARQLAIALGDESLAKRHLRTFETALTWHSGQLSRLELHG